MSYHHFISMRRCMGHRLQARAADSASGAYGPSEGAGTPELELWAEGLQPRVLVAEDNLANLFLLNSQLLRLGCQVAGVSNGLDALTQWQQGQFDCLLTDLSMPQLGGFDLVQQLRAEGDQRPAIGISADPSERDQQRAQEAGFNILLPKPVTLPVLHTVLLRYSLPVSMQHLPVYEESSLTALFDGNQGLIQKFVCKLLESNQQDFAAAKACFAERDWTGLAQMLHKIKGAARLIDARQVVRACEQQEKICKTGNVEQLEILLADLDLRLQTLAQRLHALS